jgi:hypothetical protein
MISVTWNLRTISKSFDPMWRYAKEWTFWNFDYFPKQGTAFQEGITNVLTNDPSSLFTVPSRYPQLSAKQGL